MNSKGKRCECPNKLKNKPHPRWLVVKRKWNDSTFIPNGGKPSDYSTVTCVDCNAVWRTKALYVDKLKDKPDN